MGRFRTDVEGLRAVAVLLVLGTHLFGFPRGGFVGVDVFFVVSGFLITGLLVREAGTSGRVRLGAFWARRVRRLLPVALVVLAVTCAAAQLLFLPVRAAQTTRDALWAAVSAANWRFASLDTDYFAQNRPPSPVQQYWSLAVEEQFYLVWPVLVLALALRLPRRSGAAVLRNRLTVATTAVLLGSLAWSVALTASDPERAYFSTPARAHELAAGALLALHVARAEALRPRTGALLSLAGLVGIVVSAFVISPTTPFPGSAALLPVVSTLAVLAGGAGARPGGAARLLSLAAPRYLGRVSYSLYLWHWPVVVFGLALRPDEPLWLAPVLLAVSLALAAASYPLVEQPLRTARPLRAPGTPLLPRLALPGVLAGALLVVVATAGVSGQATQEVVASDAGQPTVVTLPSGATAQRPPQEAFADAERVRAAVRAGLAQEEVGRLEPPLDALEVAAAPEWIVDECLDVFAPKEADCVYGPPQAPRTAVLLGDSVAISYLPGLRAALEPRGFKVHVLTRRGCSLGAPDDAVSPGCRDHRERVVASARALRPELVVVSGSYASAARPLVEDDAAAWRARLADAVRAVGVPGPRTVVLTPPPQSGNLQSCVTRVATAEDCVREVQPLWSALARADRAAARDAGVRFVDTGGWFCASGRCPAAVAGTPVSFDGTHLTAAYSRRLALLLRDAVT